MNVRQEKIKPSTAALWILFSIFCCCGLVMLGWFFWNFVTNMRIHDNKYRIVAVVQTGPEKEALKTVYLEELLNLSIDKPINLYRFDVHDAEKKLLTSPLIKKATVKKMHPGTLYIDYSIRQPIAYIADYSNTAIDADGILIPFAPFFTPKKIPEIFIGLENNVPPNNVWGSKVVASNLELAKNLFNQIPNVPITKIDVSKAYSDSSGQREVIMVIEDWFEKEQNGKAILCIFPRILRLSTENYQQEIADFLILRDYLQRQEKLQIVDNSQPVVRASPMVINMRIAQLAYFKE